MPNGSKSLVETAVKAALKTLGDYDIEIFPPNFFKKNPGLPLRIRTSINCREPVNCDHLIVRIQTLDPESEYGLRLKKERSFCKIEIYDISEAQTEPWEYPEDLGITITETDREVHAKVTRPITEDHRYARQRTWLDMCLAAFGEKSEPGEHDEYLIRSFVGKRLVVSSKDPLFSNEVAREGFTTRLMEYGFSRVVYQKLS